MEPCARVRRLVLLTWERLVDGCIEERDELLADAGMAAGFHVYCGGGGVAVVRLRWRSCSADAEASTGRLRGSCRWRGSSGMRLLL